MTVTALHLFDEIGTSLSINMLMELVVLWDVSCQVSDRRAMEQQTLEVRK